MKTPVYLICLAALAASCGETKQAQEQGYHIKGTVKGVDSGMVKLSTYDEDTRTSKVIDSATVTNGQFTLNGKIESPELVGLSLGDYWGFSFFLENSDINLSADTSGSQHYDWTSYGGSKGAQIKTFTVSGSASQDQVTAFEKQPALKQYDSISQELGKAYQSETDKEKGYKIKEQWDSVGDLAKAVRKRLVDSFLNANPDAAASAYLFSQYYVSERDMPFADLEARMNKLTGTAKSTVYYKSLAKTLDKLKAIQPGELAPDFTLLKTDSTKFTLSSLRGKYVMLDFWASWCVPCRKAIPHWKEAYEKYHSKGFEIVGVTNDSRWTDWFKALEVEKMPWIQVADEFPIKDMPSRVATMYMAPYLPCYVLLDKDGKILLHNASKEQIDEKLKELLGS